MLKRSAPAPAMPRTVVHIVGQFHVGGTERQAITLLRRLDRTRWQPRVLCFRKTGGLLDAYREMGIDPVEVKLGASLIRPATALTVARLARALRAENAAVVHCHDMYSVLLGVPAARLAGVPVLASRRDLGHNLTRVQQPFVHAALRGADMVLANAYAVGAQLEDELGIPAGRIAVVPNGLDLEAFDRAAETLTAPAPMADGGPPTVLTVARMTYAAKGHEDLVRAAAIVTKELDVRFALCGDGPFEPTVRKLATELGVEGKLHFLGRRFDAPALMRRCDLVCHPSRLEGLPNAVMEAMAAAKPLVATAAGGTPELAQDGRHGLIVPVEKPEALAAGILALLRDRERGARMGAAARARIEEVFGVDALVARVQRLYDHLAAPAVTR